MSFDRQLARECLRLSKLAYLSATFLDRVTSTEVLIGGWASEPETLVVAFRGSREPRDFIYDAKFLIKRFWSLKCDDSLEAKAKVHRGFHDGFVAVREQILARVRNAKRIICTGHSLGGARAIECALWLHEQGLPLTDTITFGAPRVGNAAFRDLYNAKLHDATLRFEAQGDPVPWMPLLVNGYRHSGRCVYLMNDGEAKMDPPFIDHVPALVRTALPQSANLPAHFLGVFKPHFLENYERLFAQLKEAA